jgi:hypothetical protein
MLIQSFTDLKISLLGTIGGSLGLCLGVSIMSFCELLEVIMEAAFILVDNRKLSTARKSKIASFEQSSLT